MSGLNSTPADDWVRLNVGGKIFETTKTTLLRQSESFLARLVNGGLPSKQDKSGAFLIDRSYEHFDTILNYLRSGSVNFDRCEKAMKDILCEATFYNIEPLVNEIRKAISTVTNRSETIMLVVDYQGKRRSRSYIVSSEKHDTYEVLQALREKYEDDIQGKNGKYIFKFPPEKSFQVDLEMILRNFGFVQESYDDNYFERDELRVKCWKFVRTETNHIHHLFSACRFTITSVQLAQFENSDFPIPNFKRVNYRRFAALIHSERAQREIGFVIASRTAISGQIGLFLSVIYLLIVGGNATNKCGFVGLWVVLGSERRFAPLGPQNDSPFTLRESCWVSARFARYDPDVRISTGLGFVKISAAFGGLDKHYHHAAAKRPRGYTVGALDLARERRVKCMSPLDPVPRLPRS